MEQLPAPKAGMPTDQVLYIQFLGLVVELEVLAEEEAAKIYSKRHTTSPNWIAKV